MKILRDLPELEQAGVITKDTAQKIQAYYEDKGGASTHRLLIAFGVLGATLVGLGIILIIAHNWDELSRFTKSILAFLPLFIGQLLCLYVLVKKLEDTAWRESASTFLFFSIGASISLISQIYNIPGNLGSFLLTWSLLALPLIYLMKSSIASILYLIAITSYACELGYWSWPSTRPYFYWLLLLGTLPHYYQLYKKNGKGNFMLFHNWLIPLSVVICLGTLEQREEEVMLVAYMSLFGILYMIGDFDFLTKHKLRNNGFKILGAIGTIVLLLATSFDWFWEELISKQYVFNEVIKTPEFLAITITSSIAFALMFLKVKKNQLIDIKPLTLVPFIFFLTFILGLFISFSVILINLMVFIIGILSIREGAKQNHLGILNYGLLIITSLIVCRFFDSDISYVFRGILFVSVGAGFIVTNYWMLKKRKANE